ncbi:MAG: DUF3037 domain-containing protein [Chitinophagaceae bacterium]|nr:DUF3037 domain-containing protein [Chitinophagaceae bacterium]MBK7306608.1 DUF3037 domain-containing protein [Chitinophagaceae bacterium]MBK8787698.1 DUF3037 domain-containing protein [Chitinophagaceae bacterium]MBK9484909.1 DUF3037 domain-containing protein [Chitinophagaceae bacterium]MBL0201754.1 DUF3037 domain-containing protein [Chitinophagaceae bacterium]
MQQAHLFEYAVVRVVPKVEREEFLNVGVIVYCRELSFLQVMYSLNEERLQIFCTQIDKQELLQNLQSVDRICKGSEDAGPIGNLDIAGRFRWLTATRSTIIQTSKVHPGFCTDPHETLTRLYTQLVL